MAHACNIDSRGRLFRALVGLAALAIALIALFAWALPSSSPLAWTLVAAASAAGLFCCYEAYHSWCAIRALGFKTKL